MKPKQYIQIFLDQKRDAFKTTLQQLAEYGVTIRSFTELHDQVEDVENGLPITQQLIIHAYRNALLVSTVEALFKETKVTASDASDADIADPGREERQQREAERGAEDV
jgi:hypothetical protein